MSRSFDQRCKTPRYLVYNDWKQLFQIDRFSTGNNATGRTNQQLKESLSSIMNELLSIFKRVNMLG